jgi:PAS domain S-box-containing protein
MAVPVLAPLRVLVWTDGGKSTALPRDPVDRGGARMSFSFAATSAEWLAGGHPDRADVLVLHAGPSMALELLGGPARPGLPRGDLPAVVLACGSHAELPVAALLAAGVDEICTADSLTALLDAVLVARERSRLKPSTRRADRFTRILSQATRAGPLLDEALGFLATEFDVELAALGEVTGGTEDVLRVVHECRRGSLSVLGEHPWSQLLAPADVAALRAGRSVAIDDAGAQHPHRAGATRLASQAVRAVVAVPVCADGGLRAVIVLNQREPRPWLAAEVRLLEELAGRLFAFVDRLRAHQQLARSEQIFRRLAESDLVGVGVGRLDGEVVHLNDEMLRMMGRSRADLEAGRIDWREMIAPEFRAGLAEDLRQLVASGQRSGHECAFLRPDGGRTPYLASSALIEPGDGLHAWLALDLTRVRAAEAEAQASAEFLRFAMDSANAGVWSFDLVTGSLYWSEGVYRITGFDPAQGPPSMEAWSARVHPDDLPQLLRLKAGTPDGPFETLSVQFRFYPEPGVERWILSQGRLERAADGTHLRYSGLDIDVTALRRSEQAGELANRRLEESYALLDTVFDCAPIGLTFLDRDYRYVRINQTLASLNGLPVEAHLGRTIEEVLPTVWPSVQPLLDQVRDTGVPIADVLVRAPVPGRPTGPEETWWLAGYFPIRVRGELSGFGIVAQDVTVQTNAGHLLRLADERKDRFLATLAHELRNPLAPIRNAVAILRRLQGKGDPAPLIAMIERQVVHMVRLVDDLLEVSRISRDKLELRLEPFDLRDVVAAALEISNPLLVEKNHQLHVDVAATPVAVHGDRVRLVQVTANLLNNAAKYTHPGGRIALTVAVEGGDAVIIVQDNGIGITAQDLPAIFEVFAQVEARQAMVQDGLGIGLWLVRQLATLHGGRVDAYSDGQGTGSRFVVRLPRQAAAGTAAAH